MRQHMMTASVLAVVGLGTTFPTTSAAAASNPDSINRAAVSQSAGGNLVVDVPAALIRYGQPGLQPQVRMSASWHLSLASVGRLASKRTR